MERRRFLTAIAAGGTAALAGCTASVADPRTWTAEVPEPGDADWAPDERPAFTDDWPPGLGPQGFTDWRRFLTFHDYRIDEHRYVASTIRFSYTGLVLQEREEGYELVEAETRSDETMPAGSDIGADRYYAEFDSGGQAIYGDGGRGYRRFEDDEVVSFDQRDPTSREALAGLHHNAFVNIDWSAGQRVDDEDHRYRFRGGESNHGLPEDMVEYPFHDRLDIGTNEAELALDGEGRLRQFEAIWDFGRSREHLSRFRIEIEVEAYDDADLVSERLPEGRPDWVARAPPWK